MIYWNRRKYTWTYSVRQQKKCLHYSNKIYHSTQPKLSHWSLLVISVSSLQEQFFRLLEKHSKISFGKQWVDQLKGQMHFPGPVSGLCTPSRDMPSFQPIALWELTCKIIFLHRHLSNCHLWNFLHIQLKKWEQMMCFCNKLLVTKHLKLQFITYTLWSLLLCVDITQNSEVFG